MALIPDDVLKESRGMNLAPMVDFLFLVACVFAVLAVTRASLYDTEIHLAKLAEPETEEGIFSNEVFTVNLSLNEEGKYKWITEKEEFLVSSPKEMQAYLRREETMGHLPKEREKTRVLFHIDEKAQWDPIVKMVFAVREAGYQIHPVYELHSDG